TKPGLEKVWALRIKKGCVSVLTQPLYLSKCHIINQEIRNRRSYYIRKNTGLVQKENPCI
ncbi:hypothetical protein, partial [Bacteroides ovatus]|uniref:hypothetical protein n=1 Tax=Bacteroides ovatus TaxID=28116 RepID=UPI00232B5E0A